MKAWAGFGALASAGVSVFASVQLVDLSLAFFRYSPVERALVAVVDHTVSVWPIVACGLLVAISVGLTVLLAAWALSDSRRRVRGGLRNVHSTAYRLKRLRRR
jgi:hypothetical protein